MHGQPYIRTLYRRVLRIPTVLRAQGDTPTGRTSPGSYYTSLARGSLGRFELEELPRRLLLNLIGIGESPVPSVVSITQRPTADRRSMPVRQNQKVPRFAGKFP